MKPAVDGLLVVDKPGGLTSRDVVNRVQGCLPRGTRVGHAGTLDPLATGVLVLCVGRATRLTEFVQDMDKTYRSVFRLGARSDTDDADGTVRVVADAPVPDRAGVESVLGRFVGVIEQTPPAYSAARVSGRRAYDLARRGQEVALPPRRVHVYGITVLAYDYQRLEVEVRCGKGTYIRSLARDLGERLGCGALVEVLRRTRIGPFTEAGAVPLTQEPFEPCSRLLPVTAAVAQLPQVTLGRAELTRLTQGQKIAWTPQATSVNQATDRPQIAVLTEDGNLAAIAYVDVTRRLLGPEKVFWSPPAGRLDS